VFIYLQVNMHAQTAKDTLLLSEYIHTLIHTYIHTYIHAKRHTYIHTYIQVHFHTYIQTLRYDAVLHSSFKHYDRRTFKCKYHEIPQEIHQINFSSVKKHLSYESAWSWGHVDTNTNLEKFPLQKLELH